MESYRSQQSYQQSYRPWGGLKLVNYDYKIRKVDQLKNSINYGRRRKTRFAA